MKVKNLHDELKHTLLNLLERNPYLDEDEEFAKIDFIEVVSHMHHKWCWITVRGRCVYDTETSYADYTSYTHIKIEHSWIGLAEDVPEVLSMKQLSDWALYKATWQQELEKSELAYSYKHEGVLIKEIDGFFGQNICIRQADGADQSKKGDDIWQFKDVYIGLDSLST